MIDLHTHSTASDGQYTPAELLLLAKKKNIEVLALTDHDTVCGLEEAGKSAKEFGIHFVSGIEINSQDIVGIHMLGYGIDSSNQDIISMCGRLAEDRLKRGEKICMFLKEKGIDVDYEEIKGYTVDGVVGRPHFGRYLFEHGYVSSVQEAFKRYLNTDEFMHKVKRNKPSSEESINIIHNAGGKAVIAHPYQYKIDTAEKEKMIGRLTLAGLDGIECFYSKHSEDETKIFCSWAKKYNLKVSVGSDFHGEKVKPDIALGMEFDYDVYGEYLIVNSL